MKVLGMWTKDLGDQKFKISLLKFWQFKRVLMMLLILIYHFYDEKIIPNVKWLNEIVKNTVTEKKISNTR